LTYHTTARADARALACGLALGAAVGLVLGGAYMAGGMAQTADARAKADHAAHTIPTPAVLAQAAAPVSGGALAVTRVATSPARPFHLAGGVAVNATRDRDCLADAVYYEARGETPAGQAAIAQVVLNRVRHPAFPKSVCGVVFQGADTGYDCQFSFACNGAMHRPKDGAAWARAEQIAARALAGVVMPQVGEATHFHVAGVQPGWGPRLMRVAQVGLHVFYRFGGHEGAPSTFDGPVHPSAPGSDAPGHVTYASMIPTMGVSVGGRPSASYAAAPGPTSAPAQAVATVQPVAAHPVAVQPAEKPKIETDAPAKPTQVASAS
jgi:spore germination cell wall hydrolase CwlJ-like protein